MKNRSAFLLVMLILLVLQSWTVSAADAYPSKPIQVIVGWGAGGGTDVTARELASFVENDLGQPWVITNIPGASGAIGAEQVLSKKQDGYTLLFGSETIALWPLMGTSAHWYKDFETIAISSQGVATIAVNASSPWQTLEEFIDYAQANPKKVKMGVPGPATTGAVAGAILQECLGVEVAHITYEGQAPAVVALLGGHIDVLMENLSGVIDHHEAGKLRILGVFDNQPVKAVSDIPAIGQVYPETESYLPYGAWFGLFAPKGIPPVVLDKLVSAMSTAFSQPEWQDSVWKAFYIPLGLTQDDATEFVDNWASKTAWLIYELGVTQVSPGELGIPKPND